MGVLSIDLNNIGLDYVDFDEGDPDPENTMSELWLGIIGLNNIKHFQLKSKYDYYNNDSIRL